MSQKVVRTYTEKYSNPTRDLSQLLYEGYHVVLVTPFTSDSGKTLYMEYIVEKQDK